MTRIRIGILEDDPDQSALLALWLGDAGYATDVHDSGPEFVRAFKSRGFDLLLLDWNLPEMSGLEVLEWVRANDHSNTPVIFLTTRTEEDSIVQALAAGADDYVAKPASYRELLARVAALARRSGLADEQADVLEVEEFVLDRKTGKVSKDTELVPLTRREFDLAWFLFNNLDKILSREHLLRHIWNMSAAVNTRTVDTHVSRLRGKLGLRPENGWQLSSVYHYGYRLERLNPE
jgi:DNA-binding response OmpR family regulator